MKTPFTAYFKQASIPLVEVNKQPFVPSHPMPFVAEESKLYYVGDGCQLNYRWHDAFDVFVAVLEAYLPDTKAGLLAVPVASHLSDIHLVYQLAGHSEFRPPATPVASELQLARSHQLIVYTAPAVATLYIKPDKLTHRFTIAVAVPKRKWLSRHSGDEQNPLEALFLFRQRSLHEHRYLSPARISPQVYMWLHLLLTVPRYAGLVMDDALNHPVAHLVEQHRMEYADAKRIKRDQALVATARTLARKLVARMQGSEPVPTVDQIAAALHTTNQRLRRLHLLYHGQRFFHYIYTCRLEEAKQRLSSGLPVAAVAYQLGWSEPTNFAAEFRKYTGSTPRSYRRRHGL
ncbi:helix-turn-helix domain-containing protein [Parapedobacter deserti]|uniref:Helix-turn-helix domain-containing protein n=1 Tax=Parapedobacter deserti TaxID=1912957 RepID=A0ABV7JMA6_9SPHI